MKIDIIQATIEQKPTLTNLLELYTYDLTEFFDFDIGADGLYGYSFLPLYWTDINRYPYLIYIEGKLAGFVLIQKGSPISENTDVWDIAEFFVMKKYRRQHVGSHIAIDLWDRFKGHWQVRVFPENKQAHLFWSHTIKRFVGKEIIPIKINVKEDSWLVYHFDSL